MKKILIAHFCHETNSFCSKKADFTAFKNCCFKEGQIIIDSQRGNATDLGGFIDAVLKRKDIKLIPTVSLEAPPSGPVTEDVFNFVLDSVLKAIKENSPLDGVFFNFHGAMVAENHFDAEGDISEKIREVIGENVPFMATLDLHANVTEKMAKNVDVLIPYDCYPHTDCAETGEAVARIMLDTLDGKIKPVMKFISVNHLLPLFPTEELSIKPLYEKAFKMREQKGVLSARFAHGFAPADIPEMGMSVMVVTNSDYELAKNLATELKTAILQKIPELTINYPSLDYALDRVTLKGDGPVVIADSSDNPGAGAFGDTTHILKRVLERKMTGFAFATIIDPESVKKCQKAGVGSYVDLNLGGWSDVKYSGGPIPVKAYVKMLSNGIYTFKGRIYTGNIAKQGETAILEIEGNTVIVNSLPRQAFDLEVFRCHGIRPEEKRALVVKSSVHFRADYGKIAREMHVVALKGVASPDPKNYVYKNYKGKV